VDYDKTRIATTYDAARGYRPEVLKQWLDLVAAHAPSPLGLIVDLGCGTGRFTQPLAQRFDAKAVGIDPSDRMLAVARAKEDGACVEFRQAEAEKLPLANGSVDMIFMSMVLHHLRDRLAAARECHRILRAGGRICLRNCTRDIVYPQSRFFPGMLQMVATDLPSSEDVVALFAAAGLRSCAHEIVTHTVAGSWQEFADKLALRADSFLARLPDSEFAAGLAALRAYAHGRAPEAITEQIDFFVFERA